MPPEDDSLTPIEQLRQAFLMRWVKGAWEDRTAVSVGEFFHPECVVTGMSPDRLEGIDQVQAVVNSLHARLEHTSAEVSFMMIRDEKYACVMELQGTHHDSGLDVVIEVSVVGSLKDELIWHAHNVVDYTGMYARLGILDIDKLKASFG